MRGFFKFLFYAFLILTPIILAADYAIWEQDHTHHERLG